MYQSAGWKVAKLQERDRDVTNNCAVTKGDLTYLRVMRVSSHHS